MLAAPSAENRWIRKKARRALQRADRLLDHATQREHADRDAILHEARKAYKRGRYAVEVFRAVSGKPARRLAKHLGALQDALGEQHDTVVLRDLLREQGMNAYAAGENAFTYGLLHARQHAVAARALRDVRSTRKAVRRAEKANWLG